MHSGLRLARVCVVSSLIAAIWTISIDSARPQSASSKPPSAPGPSDNSGKLGFAIESEMMTYTAMDAEGKAVACGVARNVGATDEKCTPQGTSAPAQGVVIVASPSSALAEFQLWRADISNMEMLTFRASHFCQKTQDRGASASSSSSIGSTIMSLFPGGQALSFAQTLLSRTSESAPLEGSILDQTLVNDVAGHLRSLGVSVVIPDTYMPGSLMALDERHSPYMTKLLALMKARDCLGPATKEKRPNQNPEAGGESDKQLAEPDAAEKQNIADAIEGFLRLINQGQIASPPPATASTQAQAPPQPTISHLSAVLRADGLAQEIGAASTDARSGEGGVWYLLSLKALESGGTVHKSGNAIFGSKTTYAGGAVGTYALFRLTGTIVCSGVFYNYVPAMQDTKIPNMLENGQTPAGGRLVGGCATNR